MSDTKQMAKYIFEEYANCYSEVDVEELAKHLDEIRAEAIKEFAERLKQKIDCDVHTSERFYFMVSNAIDNLVKEMVGK